MENRTSNSSSLATSHLDPKYVGPHLARIPLLPYERSMIEMLGISAEEYQFFRQEIYRKGFEEREAAYGNIPDIQNGFVATVVVTLVVGTLFTVAAAALTPKPKPPTRHVQILLDTYW